MTKKKNYKKTKNILYVVIILLLVIALCMGWAIIVFTTPSLNPMMGDGPDIIEHNTQDYYSLPPKPTFNAEPTSPNSSSDSTPNFTASTGSNPTPVDPPNDDEEQLFTSNVNKKGDNIVRVDQKDSNIINILLVGVDGKLTDNPRSRSDSMIILSYNKSTNQAKLVSVLRDSCFPVQNNKWGKLNTAMVYGGIGRTINLFNRMLGMDIQQYIIIDFAGLEKVVDIVGGIRCDITKAEEEYHKENSWKPEFKYETPLKAGKNVLLTGQQAINHARTRYLSGGDWERARRQRDVLYGILEKVKQAPLEQWVGIANEMSKCIRTNADLNMIYELGKSALIDNSKEFQINDCSMPFDGTWKYATIDGASVIDFDIDENRKQLLNLIYG